MLTALEAVDEEIEFSGCELTLSFSYSGQTSFTLALILSFFCLMSSASVLWGFWKKCSSRREFFLDLDIQTWIVLFLSSSVATLTMLVTDDPEIIGSIVPKSNIVSFVTLLVVALRCILDYCRFNCRFWKSESSVKPGNQHEYTKLSEV